MVQHADERRVVPARDAEQDDDRSASEGATQPRPGGDPSPAGAGAGAALFAPPPGRTAAPPLAVPVDRIARRDAVIGARPTAGPAPSSTPAQRYPAVLSISVPISAATAYADPQADADGVESTIPRGQARTTWDAEQAATAQAAATGAAPASPAAATWCPPRYWPGNAEAGVQTGARAQARAAVKNPGRPKAPTRPATALMLHAAQIVAWQLAVLGLLIAFRQPFGVTALLVASSVALLALTVPRTGGRWAYQWLGIWLRFVGRRRVRTVPVDGPIVDLLRAFLRGLQLETVEIDEVEQALLVHANGLTVILEALPGDSAMFAESPVIVPPPTVLAPLDDASGAPVSAQLVVQTVPAPGAYGAHGPVAESYQALAQGSVPARRRSWIALQVLRTPSDSDDDAQLKAALVHAVARLQRRLRKAGMRAHVLDRTQLAADLQGLSGAQVGQWGLGRPSVRLQERWTGWAAGPHPQVSYRLLGWPDLGTEIGRVFFDKLVTMPSTAITVGIAARQAPRPDANTEVELEVAVRIAAPPDRPNGLELELHALAGRHGVRVQRMNGEHVFGVGASLPLGGFLT